jgi:hypothetical protein
LFEPSEENFISAISNQVPRQYAARPLDYLVLNLFESSRHLVWLSLQFTHVALATDSVVANIEFLSSLRTLECMWGNKLTSIHVTGLKKLQYLNLDRCSSLTTIQDFAELTALQYLNLSDTEITIGTLAGFGKLIDLQQLIMHGCSGFDDLPQLGSLEKLTHLELRSCKQLTTLSELRNLVSLSHLDLRYCSCMTNLEVTGLTSLQFLDLRFCKALAWLM